MKYLNFVIQAYNTIGKNMDGTERIEDVTTLRLICDNADEARERAKKIINKEYYRLSEVIELFREEK